MAEKTAPVGHRYGSNGELICDSALFPPFQSYLGSTNVPREEQRLRNLPKLRDCVVQQPLMHLTDRPSYRRGVLIVERGRLRVPACSRCQEGAQKGKPRYFNNVCYTNPLNAEDECPECLHPGARLCHPVGEPQRPSKRTKKQSNNRQPASALNPLPTSQVTPGVNHAGFNAHPCSGTTHLAVHNQYGSPGFTGMANTALGATTVTVSSDPPTHIPLTRSNATNFQDASDSGYAGSPAGDNAYGRRSPEYVPSSSLPSSYGQNQAYGQSQSGGYGENAGHGQNYGREQSSGYGYTPLNSNYGPSPSYGNLPFFNPSPTSLASHNSYGASSSYSNPPPFNPSPANSAFYNGYGNTTSTSTGYHPKPTTFGMPPPLPLPRSYLPPNHPPHGLSQTPQAEEVTPRVAMFLRMLRDEVIRDRTARNQPRPAVGGRRKRSDSDEEDVDSDDEMGRRKVTKRVKPSRPQHHKPGDGDHTGHGGQGSAGLA